MDQSQQDLITIAGLALVAIVLVIVAFLTRHKRRARRLAREEQARDFAKSYNASFLIEQIEYTGAGNACAVVMVLWIIGTIGWLAVAKSAFQETVVVLICIAGLLPLGLGVALGRRRIFIMRRPDAEGRMPLWPS